MALKKRLVGENTDRRRTVPLVDASDPYRVEVSAQDSGRWRSALDLGEDLHGPRQVERRSKIADGRRTGQPALQLRFRPRCARFRNLVPLACYDALQDVTHGVSLSRVERSADPSKSTPIARWTVG